MFCHPLQQINSETRTYNFGTPFSLSNRKWAKGRASGIYSLIYRSPAPTNGQLFLSNPTRYRHISYQDEAPVLVTNSASLTALNTQLKSAIEMKRFRPNIVVDGSKAWEEDCWEHITFCKPGVDPNANPSTLATGRMYFLLTMLMLSI